MPINNFAKDNLPIGFTPTAVKGVVKIATYESATKIKHNFDIPANFNPLAALGGQTVDADYVYEDGTAILVASADNGKGSIECHYVDLRGFEPMKKSTIIHEKARGGFSTLTLVRAVDEKNVMFLVANYSNNKGALLFKIKATSDAVIPELLLDVRDVHTASLVSV